jgi:surface protein
MGSSSSKNEKESRIIKEKANERGLISDEIMINLIEKAKNSTCRIPYTSDENNLLNVLLTCEHVLDQELVFSDKDINIFVDDKQKKIELKKQRKKWSSKLLDYSCIEILKDDNIDSFYQIDDIIFQKDYSNNLYLEKNKKNIIIFAMMNDKTRGHSDGIIKKIDEFHNFIHDCNTVRGCSGGVIVNKMKNVVGMHQGEFIDYEDNNKDTINNIGIFIKDIIEDINQNNNNETAISIKYEIKEEKTIRIFGEKFVKNNKDKCKIIVNEKTYELSENYKIEEKNLKEGILEIKLIVKNNLTDLSFMFSECTNLISLVNISEWNIKNITNMSYMFNECRNLS